MLLSEQPAPYESSEIDGVNKLTKKGTLDPLSIVSNMVSLIQSKCLRDYL